MGGCAFTRGQLYKILTNPISIGERHHQGAACGDHRPRGAGRGDVTHRAVRDEATSRKPDPALIKLIRQAQVWWADLTTGEADITTIATTEMINDPSVSRVVRLNVPAQRLVDDILGTS